MLKAYKYRIYPNSEQRIQIAKTFGCCRFVYNQTLAYRKGIYEKEKKSVSKTDCNNYCNRELKIYALLPMGRNTKIQKSSGNMRRNW